MDGSNESPILEGDELWVAVKDVDKLRHLVASGWRLTDMLVFTDAIESGRTDIVDLLLESNPDLLNTFDEWLNWSPLIYAARAGDAPMVQLLIDRGADVNAHDEAHIGNTALAEAVRLGHYDVARLLVEYGADPRIEGWMRLTALHYAKERKRMPKLYELLRNAPQIAAAAAPRRAKRRKQHGKAADSQTLQNVAVFGATGHTGRFVLDELGRRGLQAILVARDATKLDAVAASYPASPKFMARIEDSRSLDRAFAGAAAVVNCAGPFLDTALPVLEAALRARIPYLDLTAEQQVVQSIRERDADARKAGVAVIPAAAFYGGLADLLATAARDGSEDVDVISVAVALDSWHPTQGTRLTGERNTARRLVVKDGILQPVEDSEPTRAWSFPAPFGDQEVAMVPLSETLTLGHLKAATIESWINLIALRDVGDAETPSPQPADERGRSAQRFVMDVVVRDNERSRRASAFGKDIYAVSAPIIVEALQRLLAGNRSDTAGVRSLGEIFDARAFLGSLADHDDLRIQYW